MESVRTLFRLVVMIGVLGIGYKAWQAYGPPADQLKALAVRALDAARSSLEGDQHRNDSPAALTLDPRPIAPALTAPAQPNAVAGQVIQAQALVPANEPPSSKPFAPPALAAPAAPFAAPATGGPNESPLKALYAQLEQFGARDSQLAEWGSGGQLYRFSCQVPVAGTGEFHQHFEATAEEPKAAVEAVLAKLTAWRVARGETGPTTSVLR